MSKEKRRKRKWGYEVIIEANTDFKEKVVRGYLEDTLDMMKVILSDGEAPNHMKAKILWRDLQPDEISKSLKDLQ